jgi:hypothetical protein
MAIDIDVEFDEIEQRIRELHSKYPNQPESVRLHERLSRYKQHPAYRDRYHKAMVMLTRSGFKTGRRETRLT